MGSGEINPDFLSNKHYAVMEELTGYTSYLGISKKQRVIKIINLMEKQIHKSGSEEGVKEFMKKAEGLKSVLSSLPSIIKNNTEYRKMLYNRVHSFSTITRWFIYKAYGHDVDEPWTLKEEEKENISENENIPQLPPQGNIPSEMVD